MNIASPAFENNQPIPSLYTCDGKNINPPLVFSDIPDGAKSLALIVEDPDVPKHLRSDGLWVHWLVWNINPKVQEIKENSGAPAGSVEGVTTYGKPGYGGPCPPDREHRYFFKLYALDTMLDLNNTADKTVVEKAMDGHIIEKAKLVGLYKRNI